MIVLRVQINDRPPVVGGASDLGVLNAIITAVGKLGSDARPARPDDPPDIFVSLGGLTSRGAQASDVHVRWVGHRTLSIGDKVTVQVLEADAADPSESEEAAKERADDEREYFEHCKRAYLELKGKYEPMA